MKRDLSARFFAKTARSPSGCLEWIGARQGNGYGHMNIGGRTVLAHRIAFELAGRVIPDGLVVCHSCDNRSCVDVAHLFIGTVKDNAQDMMRKGRNRPPAKLTAEQVRTARARRASGERLGSIAADLGVTRSTIGYLVRGDTHRAVAS